MIPRLLSRNRLSPIGVVALVLGIIFLAASMAPIPYRFMVAPKGQVYDGTEFWSDDYSAYVSYITQGQRGKWLVYDTHTSEPNLPGILIHEEYLLWGKLTGLLGINPIYAYHLFRLTLGAILIYLCWKLIILVFPNRPILQLTAYSLLLFVGGFPRLLPTGRSNLEFGNWKLIIESYIPWLTELDVFNRFVALPHYLLGNIFFVLSIIQFIKIQSSGKFFNLKSNFLILITLGLVAGFFHAVSLVTLYSTFAVYFLLTAVINFMISPRTTFKQISIDLRLFILYVALTSPILIYFKYLLTLSPWSNLSAAWESASYYYVAPKDLLLAIGPTIFLAPIGFFLLLLKSRARSGERVHENVFLLESADRRTVFRVAPSATEERLSSENRLSGLANHFLLNHGLQIPLLLFSWLFSFFLLFYFSHPFLHISQVRFFQTYLFIPASFLAAPVIVFLSERLVSLIFRSTQIVFRHLFLLLLLLLLTIPTLPLTAQNFVGRFSFFKDFAYLAYPPKDWVEAIYWLRDHTEMNSVVLAAWQGGHHIPFMAGNYVYYGHLWGTLNVDQKRDLTEKFFRGAMESAEAKEFLKVGRVAYVFWGYEEKSYGGRPEQYSDFLSPVYHSAGATIFEVRD